MPAIHGLLSHSSAALAALLALGHASCAWLIKVSPENALLGARAAFLVFSFVLAAITFTRWRHAAQRDTAHTSDQLGHVLARLASLEHLAAQIEPRLTALGEQTEAYLNSAGGGARESFPIAIRLARAGAEPAELMSSCGLTQRDAELVARLHGRRAEWSAPRGPSVRGRSAA